MKKYLLIDSNNLACRHAFGNSGLMDSDGRPTSVHYGFFSTLIALKERFNDYDFLIIWDGKSLRRKIESEEGVKKNLIKSSYKANRIKDEQPQELLDMYLQMPHLKLAIAQVGIPQIKIPTFEADDTISSYCKKLYNESEEIICLTSDHDYYQLLNDKVSVYDGMKEEFITDDTFKEKFGIEPSQHVHVGSLMGDTSDNIHGVPSCGEKTALKWIQEHGSWEAVIAHLKKLYEPIRKQYPDVIGEEFEKLKNIRTPAEQKKFDDGQEWKGKYDQIQEKMPFTGCALGFEEKRWKPSKELKAGLKTNLLALMFEERIKLAYSLKKMDSDIEDLPEIKQGELNRGRLIEYFDYYDIESLKENISVFEQVE